MGCQRVNVRSTHKLLIIHTNMLQQKFHSLAYHYCSFLIHFVFAASHLLTSAYCHRSVTTQCVYLSKLKLKLVSARHALKVAQGLVGVGGSVVVFFMTRGRTAYE